MNRFLLILAVGALLAGLFYFAYHYQPLMEAGSAVQRVSEVVPEPPAEPVSLSISFSENELKRLVSYLEPAQREQVLSEAAFLQQVVDQELSRLALYDAAVAAKLDKNNKIKYLMERQSQDLLVNSFVEDRLKAAGLPSGFPSEEQLKTYYDTHPDEFRQSERMPVWQIFWRIDKNMNEEETARLTKRAKRIAREIQAGKARFFEMANKHSQHEGSRVQAGFMGVLVVDTLKKDVKDQLLALKTNRTSNPIRSEEGMHIFRRGAVISAQTLSFEAVKEHIKNKVTQQFVAQQKAVLSQLARSQFKAHFGAEDAEKWRLKQLQNTK